MILKIAMIIILIIIIGLIIKYVYVQANILSSKEFRKTAEKKHLTDFWRTRMSRIAIITGATGGLGMEFTRVINSYENIDEIWAVGRNGEKLDKLNTSYEKVVPVCADLSDDGIEIITKKIEEEKPDIKLLVNNAGIGYMGEYEKMDPEAVRRYCELKSRKIAVTAVCPGWIDTDMLPREREGKKVSYTGMISAEKVVNRALKDNKKGKDMSTPGWFSKYFRIYSKLTPTRLVMLQWCGIVKKYI